MMEASTPESRATSVGLAPTVFMNSARSIRGIIAETQLFFKLKELLRQRMLQTRKKSRLFVVAAGQKLQPRTAGVPTRLDRVASYIWRTAKAKPNGKNVYFVGTGRMNLRAVADEMEFSLPQLSRILRGIHGTEGPDFRRALARFGGYEDLSDLEDQLRDYQPFPIDVFRKYPKNQ